jgi:hypothetical protein
MVLPLDRAYPGGIGTEKCFGFHFCLEVSPLRPLPAEHGEEFHGRIAPAEPDDPNSSTLNPNKHEKLGLGKGFYCIDLNG